MTESNHHFAVHNPRATLREVIHAYWYDSDPLFIRNRPTPQSSAQELLDVAIADFPVTDPPLTEPVADDMEYTIELRNYSGDKSSGGKTESKNNVCIQLASNYRGFISDVDLDMNGDNVHVSTETSNFVFPCDVTLRDIARTCWHEPKPLLFRNCRPAVTSAQDLLDVPVAELSHVQDQLMLEIHEKGNILYSD